MFGVSAGTFVLSVGDAASWLADRAGCYEQIANIRRNRHFSRESEEFNMNKESGSSNW